ncbi:putative drug resistance transporter [Gordonia effusa NBRC 100432]|uniref:Putative drug resistance transporter n=1 Tax=Gordonia effusa NBRC 100432 TaxID=1077974 RepID=H0QVD8_9ACTN|nr:SMR family transporter [Gordonia effusa]GAB16789.1 putative drug resistance transporter [Gordonia effusa NBRC 100432]
MKWALLAAAVLSEVAASLSLKGSATTPALYAVVVIGYVAAFILLTLVLRRGMALGVAYGVWGASGVALTAVASTLIFDETFTGLMGVGLILIIGGVLLVENGSRTDDSSDVDDNDVAPQPISER